MLAIAGGFSLMAVYCLLFFLSYYNPEELALQLQTVANFNYGSLMEKDWMKHLSDLSLKILAFAFLPLIKNIRIMLFFG